MHTPTHFGMRAYAPAMAPAGATAMTAVPPTGPSASPALPSVLFPHPLISAPVIPLGVVSRGLMPTAPFCSIPPARAITVSAAPILTTTATITTTTTTTPKPKVSTSVYIGRIPEQFTDDFISLLLKECGRVSKWTRTKDPTTGKMCSFGFCDFEDLKGVFRASHILSNLKFEDPTNGETSLLVKCEDKVLQAAEEWRSETLNGIVQNNEISVESATLQLEAEDEELKDKLLKSIRKFYEEQVDIGDKGENEDKKREDLKEEEKRKDKEDEGIVEDKKRDMTDREKVFGKISDSPISQEKKVTNRDSSDQGHGIGYYIRLGCITRDYRPHWKERERDLKYREKERELEKELLRREKDREKYEVQFFRERQRYSLPLKEKRKLIEMDLKGEHWENDYDDGIVDEFHGRKKEDRRKMREREAENDRIDRQLEEEEIRQRKLEDVNNSNATLGNNKSAVTNFANDSISTSNVTKSMTNIANNSNVSSSSVTSIISNHQAQTIDNLSPSVKDNEDETTSELGDNLIISSFSFSSFMSTMCNTTSSTYCFSQKSTQSKSVKNNNNEKGKAAKNVFGDFEEYDDELFSNNKHHKPLTKINENDEINNRKDDSKYSKIQKSINALVPTEKADVFSYQLDWNFIDSHNILETKLRPWVKVKIMDCMGTDDDLVEDVIDYVINRVKEKPKINVFLNELEKFLDTEAEAFLINLYKVLIYEEISRKYKA